MNVSEYKSLIREAFAYLFSDYGFDIVYENEYRPENDWYAVGMESPAARMLFVRERGSGSVFVGGIRAQFTMNPDKPWISLLSLVEFIAKRELDWTFLEKLPFLERPRAGMKFEAKEVRPYMKEIIEMFSSEKRISEWKPKYDAYVADRIKKRYPNK